MGKAGRPVSFAPVFYRKAAGMTDKPSSPIFLWKMGEERGGGGVFLQSIYYFVFPIPGLPWSFGEVRVRIFLERLNSIY
jgi:hypothetical protein